MEMQLKNVSSNGHKIISSGTLIGYENNPSFRFELEEIDGFKFALNLEFMEDQSTKDTNIKSNVENGEINVSCVNFNNALDTGFTNPIEIATVKNKKIFFRFTATGMNNLPVLNYCFFEE